VYLFSGRESWEGLTEADADLSIDGVTANTLWGDAILGADLNGDGYGDLVVSGSSYQTTATRGGKVFVFPGGSLSGISDANDADLAIIGTSSSGYFGSSLAAGDFTDDGDMSLAVSAPGLRAPDNTIGAGALYVFSDLSSGTLSADDALLTLYGTDQQSALGDDRGLLNAGDMTGDGTDDLLARSYATYTSGPLATYRGQIHLLAGGEDFLDRTAIDEDTWSWRATGRPSDSNVMASGDLNDDGRSELFLVQVAPSGLQHSLELLDGAEAEGASLDDFQAVALNFDVNVVAGESIDSVAAGGDTNNDGRVDFAAAMTTSTDEGWVYLYESRPTCVSSD